MFIEIAEAANVVAKGEEAADQSQVAVFNFLSFLWDRIDNWIAALVVGLFAVYFAKTIKKLVINKISDQVDDTHGDVIILAGRATYVGILSVGITAALKVAGIDITAIIAAVGFGIGFALQDLIMNFIAGVLILINHPFKIGDMIQVNGTLGKVEDIQSRSTIMKGLDGVRIVVPNSDLINNQITNFTSNPFRRIEVIASIDYNTDIQKAIQVCRAVVETNPKINKEPKPSLTIEEFGDYSIDIMIRFWVDAHSSWLDTRTEIIQQIKVAFDKSGLNMPYPTQTLYLEKNDSTNEEKLISSLANPLQTNEAKEEETSIKIDLGKAQASPIRISNIDIQQVQPIKQDFVIVPPIEEHKDLKGADFLSNIN